MTWRRTLAGALVALTLGFGGIGLAPSVARADLQSDLAAAEERLEQLGSELATMQSDLEQATEDLEATDNQIEEKELQIQSTLVTLGEKRELLSSHMRSGYKAGNANAIDFVLGSTSLEDLANRIYYMDKVTEQDAATIAQIKELEFELEQEKAQLEAQQADQQAAVESMEAQVAEYEEAVAEAQAYYDQLDAEVQAELARKAEEERLAAEQAAREAEAAEQARQAEATSGVTTAITAIQTSQDTQRPTQDDNVSQGGNSGTTSDAPSTDTTTDTPSTTDDNTSSGGDSTSGGDSSSSSSSSSGSSSTSTGSVPAPGGGLATAYACIGYPYIWGACGWTGDGRFGFDCGGLVYYCYLGYRAGTAGTIGRAIQANGTWVTDMSQLNVGDCVFTAPSFNHIGIYIGNGQMIHAPNSSQPVQIGTVYAFYGGGPFAT